MALSEVCANPCRSSQVEDELKFLQASIEDLTCRLSMLGERIHCVLRDSPAPPRDDTACPIQALVPLADQIRAHRFLVEANIFRVASWLDRIEL